MAPAYTVAFSTLGCKVAQYETEALREAFLADGWSEVAAGAAVVVVNTCTVTAEADRKCRQTVRRLGRLHPDAHVLLLGCYAQTHPEEAAALPRVSYVGGTADKLRAVAVARELLEGNAVPPILAVKELRGECFEPMSIARAPRTRAYVKIVDGCDCRCSYCAIPEARGPVRSRPQADILSEVRRLVEGGTREVVLTGIETASYGKERRDGYGLIDLLEEVDALPIDRLRISSLTPEVMKPDFIRRLSSLTHLAPHFHLSVQSGSDSVLAAMRRRYRIGAVTEAIAALCQALPEVKFTCDMIVGFPGESKEDFTKTYEFSKEANFLSMHVFAFSPRRGTLAATLPGRVSDAERAERSAALVALAHRMTEGHLAAAVAVGQPLSVLFETVEGGLATGHTASFLPVVAEAPPSVGGEILSVLPTAVRDGSVLGTIIPEEK